MHLPLRPLRSLLLMIALSILAGMLQAQSPSVTLTPVISTGLTTPIDIVHAGDGSNRLFIVQKDGRVRYLRGNTLIDSIFLDISNRISTVGERGLLSMAFHPQYSANGYFFVYYTDPDGNLTLTRFQVSTDANRADENSGQVLLSIPHTEFTNHNGGKLNFGADGFLYLTTGDGGGGGDPHFNSQNREVLLGKMIRIDVNDFATTAPFYSIPPGNPFAGPADNGRDEIWATGLRNAFRWSFDRLTHDMWIGDVGQSAREEVDFLASGTGSGTNFGWRCYEGTQTYNDSGCQAAGNFLPPVFEYDRSASGGTSITGGMVYRGSAFPSMYGWYTCIDYVSGNAWLIQPNGVGYAILPQGRLVSGIVGFGEDEAGEIFAASLNGSIYRLQPAVILATKLESFTLAIENNRQNIRWETLTEQNQQRFDLEAGTDGIHFTTIAVVPATNQNKSHRYQHTIPNSNQYTHFRLKMTDNSGAFTYSDIIYLNPAVKSALVVAPTLIQNHTVNIQLRKPFRMLRIFDMNGKLMLSRNLAQQAGALSLDISALSKGVYMIRFDDDGAGAHQRILVQ